MKVGPEICSNTPHQRRRLRQASDFLDREFIDYATKQLINWEARKLHFEKQAAADDNDNGGDDDDDDAGKDGGDGGGNDGNTKRARIEVDISTNTSADDSCDFDLADLFHNEQLDSVDQSSLLSAVFERKIRSEIPLELNRLRKAAICWAPAGVKTTKTTVHDP